MRGTPHEKHDSLDVNLDPPSSTLLPDLGKPLLLPQLTVNSRKQLIRYHTQTCALAICIAIIVLTIEIAIGCLSLKVETEAPVIIVSEAGKYMVSEYYKFMLIPSSSLANLPALETLLRRYTSFIQTFEYAKERSSKIWTYQLTASSIHIFILLMVAIVAFVNRNLKALSTRGVQFQLHFFISGALTLIFSTVMTAAFMIQFTNFPPAEDLSTMDAMKVVELRLTNILYSLLVLNIFSICFFLGAMVQRLHFISLSYRGMSDKHYMLFFPVHFFVALLATMGASIWRYKFELSGKQAQLGQATVWIITIIYTLWALYCLYQTHPGHAQYADAFCNVRIIIFYSILNCALSVNSIVNPRSLLNVICGWAAVSRMLVTYGALDNVVCHYIQTKYYFKAILYT